MSKCYLNRDFCSNRNCSHKECVKYVSESVHAALTGGRPVSIIAYPACREFPRTRMFTNFLNYRLEVGRLAFESWFEARLESAEILAEMGFDSAKLVAEDLVTAYENMHDFLKHWKKWGEE